MMKRRRKRKEGWRKSSSDESTPAKNPHKSNKNGKDSSHQHWDQKVKDPSKKTGRKEKPLKTPERPDWIEDLTVQTQASLEKEKVFFALFLSALESKSINYVKNCFWVTKQQVLQGLW